MAALIKVRVKDFNGALLQQQLKAGSIPPGGLLWAGFHRQEDNIYEPFVEVETIGRRTNPDGGDDILDIAEPGELRFRFEPDLTPAQETLLNSILTNHDSTQFSEGQRNQATDLTAKDLLISRYQNWDSLNPQEKDVVLKNLTRLVARLIDRSTNI